MKVLILLGSKSDIDVTKGCGELLDKFQIPYTQEISSAHRQPEKTRNIVKEAEEKGVEVIIAAAGMAAHDPLPVLMSYEEVALHESLGHLVIAAGSFAGGPPDYFQCPLLPVR